MQKFATFLSSLERRRRPGYVLAGGESFLRDEAERAILTAILGDDPGAGLVILDGRREGEPLEAADILDEARTRSLFADEKVISVKHADTVIKEHVDAFVSYLEDPEPDSTLVIQFESWDKRTAAARKLDRWAVDCGSLYETKFGALDISADTELGKWVASRASSHGLRLGPDVIVRLIELVGTNLAELEGALGKLALAAKSGPRRCPHLAAEKPGGALRPSDIDEIVAPSRAYSIFRVAELAVSGRRSEALAAAEACFEQGLTDEKGRVTLNESSVATRLQWAIARELETLYAAHGLFNEGRSVRDGFNEIGVPKFRADVVGRRARAFPQDRLERALELAFESECAVKSGDAEARFALERLILELGR